MRLTLKDKYLYEVKIARQQRQQILENVKAQEHALVNSQGAAALHP